MPDATLIRTPFQDLETLTGCILCGGRSLRAFRPQPQLSRCSDCGHLQLNPRPTQEAITASYDIEDDPDAVHAVWEAEREGRARMWAKRADRIAALAPTPSTALDVGAGFADFSVLLKERGWDATGTEVSDEARAAAAERGIQLHAGQLEDVDLPGGYGLITLWHVLEHLPNPGASLDHLFGLLRPGGLLVVAVPNDAIVPRMPVLAAKDLIQRCRGRPAQAVYSTWGARGVGEEVHLSFFAPRRLAKAVEERGFEVVELGLDDHTAVPTTASDRTFSRHQAIWDRAGVNLHRTLLLAARRP